MEDIRIKKREELYNRRKKIINIISFVKENWIKILLSLLIIFLILFPSISGEIFGNWLSKLVNSFLHNFNF